MKSNAGTKSKRDKAINHSKAVYRNSSKFGESNSGNSQFLRVPTNVIELCHLLTFLFLFGDEEDDAANPFRFLPRAKTSTEREGRWVGRDRQQGLKFRLRNRSLLTDNPDDGERR